MNFKNKSIYWLEFLITLNAALIPFIVNRYWDHTHCQQENSLVDSPNHQYNIKKEPYLTNAELMVEEKIGSLKNCFNKNFQKISHANPLFGEDLDTLRVHTDEVLTVSFSPDGNMLASGGVDQNIMLSNMQTMTSTLFKENAHQDWIEDLAFSPDSSKIASASKDLNITIWDVSHREVIATLSEHNERVKSLDFSPTGTVLASCGRDGIIIIWNMTTEPGPTVKHTILADSGSLNSVKFSPNGSLLASGGNKIRFLNTTTWAFIPEKDIDGFNTEVKKVEFSPDGNILASAMADETVRLWNIASASQMPHSPLTGHNDIVNSIDFSPDGTTLASCSSDKIIILSDIKSGQEIKRIAGHSQGVKNVQFSPDGTLLVSASEDATIKLWNVVKTVRHQILGSHGVGLSSIKISPDGSMLASGGDDATVNLWNLNDRTVIKTLSGHTGTVKSIDFSPDGKMLASGSSDHSVRFWNVSTGNAIGEPLEHSDDVLSVDFAPFRPILVSSGSNAFDGIMIWNTTNGARLESLTEHNTEIETSIFSSDGTILASGDQAGNIILWNTTLQNTDQWNSIHHLNGFTRQIGALSFSPNGKLLASGAGNIITLWDVLSGANQSDLTGHIDDIMDIAFSPDGKTLVSCSVDGTIRFWDVSTRKEINLYYQDKIRFNSVLFLNNGSKIITADTDSYIRIWDISVSSDNDEDGMPDGWEMAYNLDPADYWDKFDDEDQDGLMNSMEYFFNTNPFDTDSDDDLMPDQWEYLAKLNGTNPEDARGDYDNDSMINLYEYQMGLNPIVDDAKKDKDNDRLTNLEEFHFGSWANQTDTDLDGMDDYIEYIYDFDPIDPTDAAKDADGDWVSNLFEIEAGSNPRDFWSVPHLSLSILHFVVGIIIISLTIQTVLAHRRRLRKNLINELDTPDYRTALKVRSSGYSNYSAFVQASNDAQALLADGASSYDQGEYVRAIQKLEEALSIFERLDKKILIAKTVFKVARILKEQQALTNSSSILTRFPSKPFDESIIDAFDNMIQALLAETKKNWGMANNAWRDAFTNLDLDTEYRLLCQGALIEFDVKEWLETREVKIRIPLLIRLDEWQDACEINKQFSGLCQAYLLQARIALASLQFEEVEKWLNLCLKVAEDKGLTIYQNIAHLEINIFLRHKDRIQKEMEKPLTPEQQERVLEEYIKDALDSLRKEGLI